MQRICECNNNQPIVGWFYGAKGFGGDPEQAVEACAQCVVNYHFTIEPQTEDGTRYCHSCGDDLSERDHRRC